MKKLALILGFTLGTALTSFGQSENSNYTLNRVVERIARESKFEKEYFWENIIPVPDSNNNSRLTLLDNNREYFITYYDFNNNGKPDIVACFRPRSPEDTITCCPRETKSRAEIVMISRKENSDYELTYIDNDKNGYFDEVIENIQDVDFRPVLEKEFERRYKNIQEEKPKEKPKTPGKKEDNSERKYFALDF